MAFTGVYADATICLHCNVCQDSVHQTRHTFDVIPLIPRLQIQYANPQRSRSLQEYRHACDDSPSERYQDIFDGELYQQLQASGKLQDSRDLVFNLSTDGIQLLEQGIHNVWPIVITVYNLRPDERYQAGN